MRISRLLGAKACLDCLLLAVLMCCASGHIFGSAGTSFDALAGRCTQSNNANENDLNSLVTVAGGVVPAGSPESLDTAQRVCPPCGLTFISHDDYLQHMLSADHMLKARAVLRALTGVPASCP